ncbi:AMP-binding protein [Actinomadura livida]|uniref:Long-chain acyl-CoA synthetase n=1 Tax=Actinomadura livida TaxID=79909 RepID=A0A7W7IBK1_9ACTN|nr:MULTISPECIES: AMP-binding protein [Actinomadura]MBB4774086.1 long-chain acyl-CoA synthetase [Actinomadura catellatispora]GGT85001.1 long-chain-fatty-acid--CoA ligase [Actinomadura livida]
MPGDLNIPDIPVTQLLDDAAERYPRRPALIFFGREICYRDLREAVDRFADGLHRLGVQPGDRVALILPNCPQQVIAFFGVLRRGAIVVQHNPLYTEEEMLHQLADCGARVAVVLDRSCATVKAVQSKLPLEHLVVTSLIDYLPTSRKIALRLPLVQMQRRRAAITADVPPDPRVVPFKELQRVPRRRVTQLPLEPSRHLAAIQYTGGTEGRPKGAMLTHRNLIANACQQHAWDVGGRPGADVTLAVLPLFHSFGLMSCLVAPMMTGGAVVLLPRYDGDRVLTAIRKYRPTIFPGVPTLYEKVLDSPRFQPSDLRSLRVYISGAMGLGQGTIDRLGRLGARGLINCYGLTEASPAVAGNPLDGRARNLTVGLPLPMTDVVIVDPEQPTKVLPPGEPGELVVRGPQVFVGYWNAPLATAQALSKGWLRTGDIAVMDEQGFITILERLRDMIKVSGFTVAPSEVEKVLRRHPAVHDCAVVSVPDPRRGERIIAHVVEHPAYPFSADELRRHCKRYLSHYKVPDEFRPRTDLPRSLVGKVIRQRLRDEVLDSSAQAT